MSDCAVAGLCHGSTRLACGVHACRQELFQPTLFSTKCKAVVRIIDALCGVTADKQGYQQSYDAALVGADRSKDIVVLRLLNLQVGCARLC